MTWEDEKALVSWRTQSKHQLAQAKGRDEGLINYTLRLGQLTRDTRSSRTNLLQRHPARGGAA
ncbi:hypothetical protein GCM10009610_63960 [Pseudonocardia xinjiangensis]